MINENFLCHPSIFAVTDMYQLILPVKCDMLFWVEIQGKCYYDGSNGIMRTSTRLHRAEFPQSVLDEAGAYTVCFRKLTERKPYFTESEDTVRITYKFKALKKDGNIKIYHLADTHGFIAQAIKAGGYFGEDIDVLILNGDMAEDSSSFEKIADCYRIVSEITHGELPCVFSRGNHDLRGEFAELLSDYTPNFNGSSYYWFKLGCIFGLVADCGEDKKDDHPEYGHTVCCESFREKQTDFIKSVVDGKLYEESRYRLIISHIPFTYSPLNKDKNGEMPFNIETERYTLWAKLLKEIKPSLMLCGHLHKLIVSRTGSKYDSKGQPCTVVIGSLLDRENGSVAGTALTLDNGCAKIEFTDENKNVLHGETVDF